MCYHTALIAQPQQLALRFGKEFDRIRDFRPTYHVSAFTHAEYPIITSDPQIQFFRWGLIPFWTDSIEDAVAIRNRRNNLYKALVSRTDTKKTLLGSGVRVL